MLDAPERVIDLVLLGELSAHRFARGCPFARPCFSLAWAWKKTAHAVDIGITGLFKVGIAALVIERGRLAARPAGVMMFRCSGRLDLRRCNQRRAEDCYKRLAHFDLRDAGRPSPTSLCRSVL
jgi:hypothetical protein